MTVEELRTQAERNIQGELIRLEDLTGHEAKEVVVVHSESVTDAGTRTFIQSVEIDLRVPQ